MTNREVNNKQWLPKNFNLFVLIKKELQEQERNQNQSDDLVREREFLERETLGSIFGKIT